MQSLDPPPQVELLHSGQLLHGQVRVQGGEQHQELLQQDAEGTTAARP